MKRFYDKAAVAARGDAFAIELDGREVKTPEKRQSLSPTKALAEAICGEWKAQGNRVVPESMPLTRLQNTAIDRVAARRDDLIAQLVTYAGTDLLCYRAEYPPDLAQQQADIWQPLLDWVQKNHEMTLKVTSGILPVEQAAGELAKLEGFLKETDSFRLAAFHNITALCGSVSVALNLLGGNLTADGAWTAALLDENYQARQWGLDDEAVLRQKNMKAELDMAVQFLILIADRS